MPKNPSTKNPSFPFPDDFLWGCATASYQVEGAAREDGRGPSVWDTFSHSPGRVVNDDTGDVACDQYHRYKDDVRLVKGLGAKAYRFSLSWSRCFPTGRGAFNPAGAAYYDRLVDELLANGIDPWVTFFHWDLPQAIETDVGGWASRDCALWFADFVAAMTARLSDRVRNYFTINEFVCFTDLGYREGRFAPGRRESNRVCNQVRHHALLGHGLAARAIRANAKLTPNVGLADNPCFVVPLIETPVHVEAARKAMRTLGAGFLTAVMEGRYLDSYLVEQGADAPQFTDADMAVIGTPLDFVGLNMYTPTYVLAADNARGFEVVALPQDYPRMDAEWLRVGPQITYWSPRLLSEVWDVKAVYITENGCCCRDVRQHDGRVLDPGRVMYLRNHFANASRAVQEGYPLKGYFVWSLLDNFEWADGYSKRFGLVYVDYHTQERIPKLSAEYFRQCVAANAAL